MKAAQDIHNRRCIYSLQYMQVRAKENWNVILHIKFQKVLSKDNKDKHKFHWLKLIIDPSKQPVVVRQLIANFFFTRINKTSTSCRELNLKNIGQLSQAYQGVLNFEQNKEI